jgi:hypothetical protein
MQYQKNDQMFTEFPIEQIEQQIKYLTDFSMPLPSTEDDITYKREMNGSWSVASPNWIGLKGRKYSLVLHEKDRGWHVHLHGMFLCELANFDGYLSPIPNKKHGSKVSGTGSFLLFIGISMMLRGLFYDTSVESSSKYSFDRVINSGKVSDRETITNIGGFLSICGSIFICRASNKQSNDN